MSIRKNILVVLFLSLLSLSINSCGGESTVKYKAPTFQNAEELTKLRAREKEALTTYKLLDAGKGIYQIPIDSAFNLLLETNLIK